jgi:hypothetical protein
MCDLLERELSPIAHEHAKVGSIDLPYRPFQIITVKLD